MDHLLTTVAMLLLIDDDDDLQTIGCLLLVQADNERRKRLQKHALVGHFMTMISLYLEDEEEPYQYLP
jgi:hypothetical protein